MHPKTKAAFDRLRAGIGKPLGSSRWYDVTQAQIDQFSASTCDNDPMHLDVEWSLANTSFGGTVAAGFWTTSMLIAMSHDVGFIDGFGADAAPERFYALNYGFNRHRLLVPVPVGRRIRGHFGLKDVEDRGEGKVLLTLDAQVEIEDEDRPALVAEWLAMVVLF